jgi:hypothetical protein
VAIKGEVESGVGELGKQCMGCWFLWSLCVFRCICIVVVEGACVRDCRGFGSCKVGIVSWSGDECVGERGSLLTVWGRMGGEGEG